MRDPATVDASHVLLRDLIDYAGLFPPASLSMAAAVANYDAYTRSEWKWILGRFIVPVARLAEFKDALAGLPVAAPATGFANWRLSALLGSDPVDDVAGIRKFNARRAGFRPARRALIESLEMKVASPDEIKQLSGIAPARLKVYFEFPPNTRDTRADCIAAVARCGRRAKLRTGGEIADKFPTSESVIEFIRLCAAANVPFKATAGLHHPLRSVHRFTYQPGSASGMMHGFLNLFLASAFLRAGSADELAVQLLQEQSSESFQFDQEGISWRAHSLSRDKIAAARRSFAISFGSCSFTEPIEDLQALHLL